ncbi:MAG: ComEA family DNA-binding protein [Bacilli bacterium]
MDFLNNIKELLIKYKKQIIIVSSIFITFIISCAGIYIYYSTDNKEADNMVAIESPIKKESSMIPEASSIIENKIFVDIKGKVNKPGVYEMNKDDKVIDVINRAQGLSKGASTEYINLSKKVTPEMVIIIYSCDEVSKLIVSKVIIPKEKPIIKNDAQIKDTIDKDNKEEVKEDKEVSKKININSDDIEELKKIKGIGDAKAKKILDYRKEKGNFKKIEDIKEVSGISDVTFNKIKEDITV